MRPSHNPKHYPGLAGVLLIFSAAFMMVAFFVLAERGVAEIAGLAMFMGLLAWIVTQIRRW